MTVPVVAAPMAGACPPQLAIAVTRAGGMGSNGVVNDPPARIAEWMTQFREGSSGPVQLNVWIPDPPVDDPQRLAAAERFLATLGTPGEPKGSRPDFDEQCAAMLDAGPTVVSSIMGRFDDAFVTRVHDAGIAWFACATTVDDALAAQDAGADAVVAQGMEAGGHRGSIDPADAERTDVGMFALLPRMADRLDVPIVASGGIADGRGVAAALTLGASAVQVGTALLRAPETGIDAGWSAALEGLAAEDTVPTRAYSGRLGRAVPTRYVRAWHDDGAPLPAPYPQQRGLVARMRAGEPGGVDRVNHWAGQNAALATTDPAAEIVARMWREASALLG
jgi:nitronate monooxygenase